MVTRLGFDYPIVGGGGMIEIYIGIMTLVVVVIAVIAIRVLIELRRDLEMVRQATRKTEESLLPVLQELQRSLESVRHVSDNVYTVTEDARALSSSVRKLGENVMQISDAVASVAESGAVTAAGLKLGVRAAVTYFLKNFPKRKI